MPAAVITTGGLFRNLGTHHLVKPLPEQASLAVLAAYLSPERVSAERDAALDVSTYCGGLPLALRIAAARLNRGMWIADLARLLHDAQHRLSELDTGRQALRAGLESLVQTLSATERQTLTQLARLPTHIIAGWAPALACRSAREAFRVISALEGAQLVTPLHQLQPGRPQRYTLHGLVRLFAAESKGGDPELDDISQAVGSVWFELGRRAIVQLSTRHLDPAGLCHADVTSIDQSHVAWVDENPLRWFDDEVGQLTDTLRDAAERGWHRLAAGLLNVLGGYFRIRHDRGMAYVQ
jgi:hypothetical protein